MDEVMNSIMSNMRKAVADETAKRLEEAGIHSDIGKYIACLDHSNIGSYGHIYDYESIRHEKELANSIYAITRRKLKGDDIVVMTLDSRVREYETGIAFTETGIYAWSDEEFVGNIDYVDIKDVDYSNYTVQIGSEDSKLSYKCDDKDKAKYMYNFIMDIKDYVDSHK